MNSLQERFPSTVSQERLEASGNTVMLTGGGSGTGAPAPSAESTGTGGGLGNQGGVFLTRDNRWLFAAMGLTIQMHQLEAFKQGRSTWNIKELVLG